MFLLNEQQGILCHFRALILKRNTSVSTHWFVVIE